MDKPEAAIPDVEIDLLLNTVDEALALALARRPEDGAAEILYGVNRAKTFCELGEPRAPGLLQRYRTAYTNFCFRYRVRPGARP
ncbi:MAG: hypothetical protein LC772_04785 [Chloroflexi bacterium]|nr:hypothetical protein [Chloroflexota bacterium]